MSHFSVAVITPNPNLVGSLLAPYRDNNWDWWVVGGRFADKLLVSLDPPTWVSSAKIKDVLWNDMAVISQQEAAESWDNEISSKLHDTFIRFVYDLSDDITRDSFIERSKYFCTYAVITPDGRWHAPGTMGWWGISSETDDEYNKWRREYFDRFIKPADPEHYIVIVDCHI